MQASLREEIANFLRNINGPDDIYEFFKKLNYPKDVLLDSSYKRDVNDFEFKEEDKNSIKNIYTVLSFEKNLVVFLLETRSLSSSFIRSITKTFSQRYENFLLIITPDYYTFYFVLPDFEIVSSGKHKLKITKLFIQKDDPYYTAIEVLSNLYYSGDEKSWRDVYKKWKEAFSVKRVTEEFFEDYKKIFFKIRNEIKRQGISPKDAHEFTLQLLNRIMFVYFVSKKRWLNNDLRFMRSYWRRYKQERSNGNAKPDTFYEVWLKNLFFKAFNNRQNEIKDLPEDLIKIFYTFPYLNGGLFLENRLDQLPIKLKDDLFSEIFDFFNKYNFTIKEDMPLEEEVAVDPAMIGYVYESLANVAEEIYDRNDLGIFYTPRVEVDFMCRRSLVEYLSKHLKEVPKEILYKFVFGDDEEREEVEKYFNKSEMWHRLEGLLNDLTVVDPACGSGSFLVGMMNVLFELYKVIYKNLKRKIRPFDLKSSIIGRSLFGVDVMPWAVHAAELRLWLQLIIETDFTSEQLKERPLLPNFNLNLRVGDSVVQEIGGMLFSMKSKELSEEIKRKLYNLRKEKENYYNNLPSRFQTREEILEEEIRIFDEIVDERIAKLNQSKAKLEKDLKNLEEGNQLDLFGRKIKASEEEIRRVKEELEKIIKELENLGKIKESLKEAIKHPEKKPFIWEIDFAEIFGDKGGFDIVIGNPPYVRQEKISPPNRIKAEVTLKDRREYKEKLINSVKNIFPIVQNIDKKSDYYVYFYFHGLRLLNKNGVFCFITSSNWLDVDYGKELQEFLLKYVPIIAIYDCPKRSFEHADINTVIVLFGAPIFEERNISGFKFVEVNKWPALSNVAKFIMFKKPYEEAITPKNLIDIENIKIKVRGENITELIKNVVNSEDYRCFPILQEDLLEDGWEYPENYDKKSGRFEDGVYVGNKWGGKFLRAPSIFYKILERGEGKFVRLGDIANIRFGIKTGANEFFYLQPSGKPASKGRIHVKNRVGWEGEIEEEFLRPLLKSPRECDTILVDPKRLKYKVFICNKSKSELKGTKALEYIKWGEQATVEIKRGAEKGKKIKGYQNLETIKSRSLWYSLGEWKTSKNILPMFEDERKYSFYTNHDIFIDAALYYVYTKENEEILCMILNSTLFGLFKELLARAPEGLGALQMKVYDYEKMPIISISELKNRYDHEKISEIFNNFIKRKIRSIFEEVGIDPNKPIREQEPNPLPDRAELDKIIFDALGLTEEERKEVYWSVCELVKQRLDKAKSLKKREKGGESS